MLIRKSILVLAIVFLLTAAGCSTPVVTGGQTEVDKTGLAYVYIQAVEELLKEDPALNEGMKYIAIEMKTLEGISKDDQEKIIGYIENKYTKVKNASLEDLVREGEFDEQHLYLKNGIAIRIDKVNEFSDSCISFEASKYRSGDGSIGMEFNFKKQGNEWNLESFGMNWIS
jgi:hypothetical protein